MAILLLIIVLCLNSWILSLIKMMKNKFKGCGKLFQGPPISVLIGLGIGFAINRLNFGDTEIQLQKSFAPLFMTVFLPFIIIDAAVNKIPTVK